MPERYPPLSCFIRCRSCPPPRQALGCPLRVKTLRYSPQDCQYWLPGSGTFGSRDRVAIVYQTRYPYSIRTPPALVDGYRSRELQHMVINHPHRRVICAIVSNFLPELWLPLAIRAGISTKRYGHSIVWSDLTLRWVSLALVNKSSLSPPHVLGLHYSDDSLAQQHSFNSPLLPLPIQHGEAITSGTTRQIRATPPLIRRKPTVITSRRTTQEQSQVRHRPRQRTVYLLLHHSAVQLS